MTKTLTIELTEEQYQKLLEASALDCIDVDELLKRAVLDYVSDGKIEEK
jgi:hypothetical protein